MRRGFFAMRAPLSLSAESTLGDLLSRLDDGMELLSAAMAREKIMLIITETCYLLFSTNAHPGLTIMFCQNGDLTGQNFNRRTC